MTARTQAPTSSESTRAARTSAEPARFSATGPLPDGVTVLEASAGTGKTYAIAALAARYVAEAGVDLGQVMMVTFGRMATDELRQRVRERLVGAERALRAASLGLEVDDDDAVTCCLLAADAPELQRRHVRVARALADFDAATIATTHEFSAQMLAGLGVLGESEPDATFVESLSDLVHEVATDCYLRRFSLRDAPPALDYEAALRLAHRVVDLGHTRLVPALAPGPLPETDWADRVAFAHDVRTETARRKELGRLYSYEDMLTRLQRSLTDPDHGEAAADRLRSRYRVVLVDEFQDTDPIQWDILRTAFVGHSTLVLIGDPKQAIYAFRGADVYSYLDAVAETHRTEQGRLETLSTNWRSDRPLVEATDGLLAEAALGTDQIVARPMSAQHRSSRLCGADGRPVAPLRLRVVPLDPELRRLPPVASQRDKVSADLVAEVHSLLASGTTLRLGDETARPLRPSDVAVLVHTNKTGERIRQALVDAAVPAVMLGATSVFESEAAREWLTLLRAAEQPRSGRVRAVALTSFLGWDLPRLATADEDAVAELTQDVRSWARVLARRGVAALVEVVSSQTDLPGRLLAAPGGERRLTDLRHVGQLLHQVAVADQLGVAALADWLRERIEDAAGPAMTDRTRRLETQAEAVSVLTVHRSKGLEFPVVLLPELWDRWLPDDDNDEVLTLHETSASAGSECVLDVGGSTAPGRADRLRTHRAEAAGEDLRLGYVALTRAQCQVLAWWAPSKNTAASTLQRLLFGARGAGLTPASHEVDGDPTALRHLGGLGIDVERVGVRGEPDRADHRGPADGSGAGDLAVRRFDRVLDTDWRRTSYSSLTAAAHGVEPAGVGVGSEDDVTGPDDELVEDGAMGDGAVGDDPADREEVPAARAGEPSLGAGASPAVPPDLTVSAMAYLPGGTEFGTVVHGLLEAVDLDTDDLDADLREAAATLLARAPASTLTAAALSEALLPSLRTPLGPLTGDRALADLGRADRLAELDFELPLSGGDQAVPVPDHGSGRTTTLRDVAALLRVHLPAGDPLTPYPDRLEHPLLAEQTLRGYLTGSIDAVLRVPAVQTPGTETGSPTVAVAPQPRYLVVDYKTNVLGEGRIGPALPAEADGQRLTLAGYRPDRLATAMMAAHYPLQALLYSVALHRFLRWRQPGYDPDTHLGGVLYLFLRGMAGATPPRVAGIPYGVFSWRPPAALVVELSALLDAPRPDAGAGPHRGSRS